MQHLVRVNESGSILGHKLTPEVRAMLAAMSSRMPAGGIEARYREVVEAVAEGLWAEARVRASKGDAYESKRLLPTWEKAIESPMYLSSVHSTRGQAEERLCDYPLHPKVQGFFDTNIAQYGHSSPLELTGNPAAYTEGISWFTAWLLFDSPLCTGQEFSTRAVRRRNWPLCREAYVPLSKAGHLVADGLEAQGHEVNREWAPHPELLQLHIDWLDAFEADVAAWQVELRSRCLYCREGQIDPHSLTEAAKALPGSLFEGDCPKCNGTAQKYPWIKDPQAFRPALDRARSFIPGTIATGCCHTGHLRERARVLRDGKSFAKLSGGAVEKVWDEIAETYRVAVPGLADLGLREAIFEESTPIPGHWQQDPTEDGRDVFLNVNFNDHAAELIKSRAYSCQGPRSYVDPYLNRLARVNVRIRCSLAVARDWHRHRTFYPWQLRVVLDANGLITMDHHYRPMSDLAKEKLPELIARSSAMYHAFMAKGDRYRAMLCLPFGTRVELRGSAGLRDALYTFKLRKHARGANFEYQDQATQALALLKSRLERGPLSLGNLVGIVD